MFDPPGQIDPDENGARRGRRRARPIWRNTLWRFAIGALVAAVAFFAVLITRAVHESTHTVADPAASASATLSPDPSTSDGGVSRLAQVPSSVSPSAPSSVTAAGAATPAPTQNTATPAGNTSYEDQVVTLVNQERAKAGCTALTVDSRLVTAARGHSQDMATRNYFAHNTPEGVTPWTRITNAGYRFSSAAENIASGQATPAAVMTAWMNSQGHRENILNCNLRNIGVGLAYNTKHTPYWTQDFGTPA